MVKRQRECLYRSQHNGPVWFLFKKTGESNMLPLYKVESFTPQSNNSI